MIRGLIAICVLWSFLPGCTSGGSVKKGDLYFTLLKSNETNIAFNNRITESDSVNVFVNEYMYNGSGVGIGDFNNDGLADVFFGGSMVSSKLYLNKGNFKFEDITESAGVQTSQWCTGISVVDINGDGFLDIYVNSSHDADPQKRKNLLFINDGKLHFTEQAAAYGLADTGCSTQSAFFDYDQDGDLDMYLLNHRLFDHMANNLMPKDTSGNSPAQDRLYRNDGKLPGNTHPTFTDVAIASGIKEDGYGLGIVITDVNNDNWPDIYVANDYIGNDLLWLNNKNGSFSNRIATVLRHQSYNSMGVDAADINNDGLQDLAVVDMMPEENERRKMMFNIASQEKYDMQQRMGYEPAFVRNMLQLNQGNKGAALQQPFFSEIGQLAGISETDWSWSVLMADFDNDGWKDMHITNGLAKDVTNNDFTTFRNERAAGNYTFGGGQTAQPMDKNTISLLRKGLDEYGSIKKANYFFRNMGNLAFSNETEPVGLAIPSVSNGAAYADMDNDGDLDLVVNNMNQEAFLYRNEIRKAAKDTAHNFIAIALQGPANNPSGLGCKISLFTPGGLQVLEQSPVRGFSSSVDHRLHFGLGKLKEVDSIWIQWPDNKTSLLRKVAANQLLKIGYTEATTAADVRENSMQFPGLFTEVSGPLGIDFTHTESQYFDYGSQRGLLQKYSQLGPCMATGDVNGDGLEDFFVGGAAYQSGKIFIQQPGGTFRSTNLLQGNKPEEDLSVSLFDADGDKDLDLLISGGSSEFGQDSPNNYVRLYQNDGKGNFTLHPQAIPGNIALIAKALAVADFDGDNDLDIFLGGYVVPQKYPQSPRSYILQNNKGVFTDITRQVSGSLVHPGIVTDAIWTDFNGDKRPDLVICGEWMPVRMFQNNHGKLEELTTASGPGNGNGMWRCLQEADIDGDGDMDFVAGNMGRNNRYRVAPGRPMMMFAKDVDNNGTEDIVSAYHMKNKEGSYALFPDADRNQLADRIPMVKKKYLLHQDYSVIDMEQLVHDFGKDGWLKLSCEKATSIWIENLGGGKFRFHDLPVEAQFAPINAILPVDVDSDGKTDLVIGGNEYETDALIGRYDASYGLILKGDGRGNFKPVRVADSGFILDGDIKDLKLLNRGKSGKAILVSRNNQSMQVFAFRQIK